MIKFDSFEGMLFALAIIGLLLMLNVRTPAGAQTAYVAVLGMVILVVVISGYMLVIRSIELVK